MVLFFECSHPEYVVYMGTDKFENEKLLANGFPEDLWFHVDDFSSAHVYLRIPLKKWRALLCDKFPPKGIPPKGGMGQLTEEDYRSVIPDAVIEEMCTLVKGNSIEGGKRSEVDIVWSPFSNMRKDQQTMETGTVGFKDEKQCFYVKNCPKNRDDLKRLEKTRKEIDIDLPKELEERMASEMAFRKKVQNDIKSQEKEEKRKAIEMKDLKSYKTLHQNFENVTTNDLGPGYTGSVEECRELEDDFM